LRETKGKGGGLIPLSRDGKERMNLNPLPLFSGGEKTSTDPRTVIGEGG